MVLPLLYQYALPFGNLNNQNVLAFFNNNYELKNSNSYLILKPAPDLELLFNHFNNVIPENNSDPENVIHYDMDELQQLKVPNKGKSVSFSYSCSLHKNFEELTKFTTINRYLF